jgi:hypothetical protein
VQGDRASNQTSKEERRTAIQKEQMGSAMVQPKFIIQNDEKITPTLPRVSAITCSQMPEDRYQYPWQADGQGVGIKQAPLRLSVRPSCQRR